MAGISQSAFLQALGWATLNSFWQVGFMWCTFLIVNKLIGLSAQSRYRFSVAAIFFGFIAFCLSFFAYLGPDQPDPLFRLFAVKEGNTYLPLVLSSASVAYLLLLAVPVYRLFQNWRFVQSLRKVGLRRAAYPYKLFVQRIAPAIGIKKPVGLFLSDLVTSPVTVGFLKPVILLPIASFNNLTTLQVEAVLLHELSHIRRNDYLVNILINLVYSILYFNPFIRLFVRTAETERETCCDALVLQFGYDKIGYASALLNLEKAAQEAPVLAMAAAGKKHLLHRIENIIGLPSQRQKFQLHHFTALLAAILCVFALHSLFIVSRLKGDHNNLAFNTMANPFYNFRDEAGSANTPNAGGLAKSASYPGQPVEATQPPPPPKAEEPHIIEEVCMEGLAPAEALQVQALHVAYDLDHEAKDLAQKAQVEKSLEVSKKVLSTLEWKKVQTDLADVLTEREKQSARDEYLKEVEKVNWSKLEDKLLAEYQSIDWNAVNLNMETAVIQMKLDSLQVNCEMALKALRKVQLDSSLAPIAFPDQSFQQIQQKQEEITRQLNIIKSMSRKTIKL